MVRNLKVTKGTPMTRFTLQISDQLNQWLTEQARLTDRSKNKLIEHLLKQAAQCPECKGVGRFMITIGEFETCESCGGSGSSL